MMVELSDRLFESMKRVVDYWKEVVKDEIMNEASNDGVSQECIR